MGNTQLAGSWPCEGFAELESASATAGWASNHSLLVEGSYIFSLNQNVPESRSKILRYKINISRIKLNNFVAFYPIKLSNIPVLVKPFLLTNKGNCFMITLTNIKLLEGLCNALVRFLV